MENNKLNVVIVQILPKYKDIQANIDKITSLLSKYSEKDKIDIVLFPEMALTGYVFDNKDDIYDLLEEYNKGKTYDFCVEIANRLKSYVFMGYPEKTNESGEEKFYNSCMIIDKEGSVYKSYRKCFLYKNDKTWCEEGKEFGYMELNSHGGKTVRAGLGICMDINPYEFTAPWEKFEFGNHCFKNDVDVILFLTNWNDTEPKENTPKEMYELYNYWLARLEPFFKKEDINKKPVYFLAANRNGTEKDTSFAGFSCAIKMRGGDSATILKKLDKVKEDAFVVTCII